jgi:signal peptidase I
MDWLGHVSIGWVLAVMGLLGLIRVTLARPRVLGRAADETAKFLDSAILALAVVFLLLRPFVAQAYFIPTGSMEDTLQVGDRLLVNKLAYRFGSPRRGDVVLFTAPPAASPEEKDFVKRVIGLPGDTVAVVPPRALVDGRVAAAFVNEHAPLRRTGLPVDEGWTSAIELGHLAPPPVLDAGTVVATRSDGSSLRLRAVPHLAVRVAGDEVYNDGTRVGTLSSGEGVRVEENMVPFGGDPAVEAAALSVNGEPELILVRGERLSLDPGHLLLNGVPQRETYLKEPPAYAMPPYKLPAGCYWVMGDNRNDSSDSHAWGPLEGNRIFGRADLLFWPLGRFGRLGH